MADKPTITDEQVKAACEAFEHAQHTLRWEFRHCMRAGLEAALAASEAPDTEGRDIDPLDD
jgi:hypothetical protein